MHQHRVGLIFAPDRRDFILFLVSEKMLKPGYASGSLCWWGSFKVSKPPVVPSFHDRHPCRIVSTSCPCHRMFSLQVSTAAAFDHVEWQVCHHCHQTEAEDLVFAPIMSRSAHVNGSVPLSARRDGPWDAVPADPQPTKSSVMALAFTGAAIRPVQR